MLHLRNTAMSETCAALGAVWRAAPALLDCALRCPGGEVGASRAVLAAHSAMLARAMEEEAEEVVVVVDTPLAALTALTSLLHGEAPSEALGEEVVGLARDLGLGEHLLLLLSMGGHTEEQRCTEEQRSTEEDLRYIFGETMRRQEGQVKAEEAGLVEEVVDEVVEEEVGRRRRSRRTNQGTHWKFRGSIATTPETREACGSLKGKEQSVNELKYTKTSEEETEEKEMIQGPKVVEGGSDTESVMSDLTSTLEAFSKEIKEGEVGEEGGVQGREGAGSGDGKRKRKYLEGSKRKRRKAGDSMGASDGSEKVRLRKVEKCALRRWRGLSGGTGEGRRIW